MFSRFVLVINSIWMFVLLFRFLFCFLWFVGKVFVVGFLILVVSM